MEISFIVPLFDRLDLARPCVESLLGSVPQGLSFEVLLVDDASTDGTRAWVAGHTSPPFVPLLREANGGYAAAVNTGARAARGRLLALLNGDLVFAPGWLEPMRRALENRRRAGIVGNLQYRVDDGSLDHAGIVVGLDGKPTHLASLARGFGLVPAVSRAHAVTGACCLLRRGLFLELGGYDESFVNGCEDVDLCFRLRRRGWRVLVANRSRVLHHVSASPGRKDRDERNSRRLCLRWRERLVLDGATAWPAHYLAAHWSQPRDFEPRLLWQALLRRCGLVRRPAWEARRLVAANLDRERAHWLRTLGHEPGVV